MESRQAEEITALRAIYAEDFIECPPPKAWRGAMRLPEFTIKVPHPDPSHSANVYIHLNTKFPKTYPEKACPMFSIQQPIKGLPYDRVAKLTNAINAEAQHLKGGEVVFQIVTYAQDWMADNVKPAPEMQGSFAAEMIKRALDEERAKKERAEAEAREEMERAAARAAELHAEIRADAERHHAERERTQHARRERANTDATEVPDWLARAGDTPIEAFSQEIELSGVRFGAVKLFHPRKGCLGMTYLAEPVCDDVNTTLPLELYVIEFTSAYYLSAQGKKRLRQLEIDLRRFVGIRTENLLGVHAIKMNIPTADGPSRLAILCEQRPPSSLQDVLADCDCLREDRATDYIKQILSALQAIHHVDIVHRGLSIECIGLANRTDASRTKQVKISKAGWFGHILALHKSNSIGPGVNIPPEPSVSEAWQPKEAIDSPLSYTRTRDIQCAGFVLLQMLLGRDVMDRFPDPQEALHFSSASAFIQQLALKMIVSSKRHHVTCQELMADIAEQGFRRNTNSPAITMSGPKTPIPSHTSASPPDRDYFQIPALFKSRATHSRYKEDWDELERLGSGGFGSVFKARNKIDHRVYAVKKIKLRAVQSKKDEKIFREVNTLSRLNHRFIVRYFTTWVETNEPESAAPSDSETEDESEEKTAERTADGIMSTPDWRARQLAKHGASADGEFSLGLNPFRVGGHGGHGGLGLMDDFGSGSQSSFPSIHFDDSEEIKGGSSSDEEGGSSEDDDHGVVFNLEVTGPSGAMSPMPTPTPPRAMARTLYIQMEFVENQTLRERIADGLSVADAWKLFHQILDALVHISSLGILHRDIKLTNIFIDGRGDVKVGDFGLATSSLAAVDPSEMTLQVSSLDSDMTQDVGTTLYIAPEIRSRGGHRNHSKADMYSLGIVFFEMNYPLPTMSERVAVIEQLRRPEIKFPSGWDIQRQSQRKIIEKLLQHDPSQRPSALELSQGDLLPPRVEDEYFKGALQMMAKPDSAHFQTVLSSLFSQPVKPISSKVLLYDHASDAPEHSALNGVVQQKLAEVFHLHGAVDMEPLLLMPRLNADEGEKPVLLDRHGNLVTLPDNGLVPFARLAARREVSRIKRYHIGDVYRADLMSGHPHVSKTAVFDIITPDLTHGPSAAAAEVIAVTDECLSAFPTLGGQNCEIRISHAKIVDIALGRIPSELREDIVEILKESKSTSSQKRTRMLKKGLLRSVADELELLNEIEEEWELYPSKLEKLPAHLSGLFAPFLAEIKETVQYVMALGVTCPITLRPLMVSKGEHFKDGVCFEIVRGKRRSDIVASGGRYDSLIASLAPAKQPNDPSVCAVGVQIEVDKITAALAAYQSTSVKTLIKEQRSFGFWSPRRCDVYVVSYQPGHLQDRLEVAAMLWQHGISADIMYESGLPDAEQENHLDTCIREGILFTVYPRHRTARRDQPAFKVKSVLKGSEYEVSRQELVGWLQHQIAEQKRADASMSGVSNAFEAYSNGVPSKELPTNSDVQLVLPGDAKKQRKHTKQLFFDRAFEIGAQVKAAAHSGMQVLAVDVPIAVFEALTKNAAWVNEDDAWRSIVVGFPTGQTAYAQQVRDAAARRKADGLKFLLLFAVREERVGLLTF